MLRASTQQIHCEAALPWVFNALFESLEVEQGRRGKVTLGEILAIYTHHLTHHMVFIDGKRKALGV